MTGYQDLHWGSIQFLHDHLYRRLVSPLNVAMGRLDIARHVAGHEDASAQYELVSHSLEMTFNLIKAWGVLVHVESGGVMPDDQRHRVAPEDLPEWLMLALGDRVDVYIEYTAPVLVHAEVFYESLQLLCQITGTVGRLQQLVLEDALGDEGGFWARAIFEPPPTRTYTSLRSLLDGLDNGDPLEQDIEAQIRVLGALMKINRGRLTLQNNPRTGVQALAAWFPVAEVAADAAEAYDELPDVFLLDDAVEEVLDARLDSLALRMADEIGDAESELEDVYSEEDLDAEAALVDAIEDEDAADAAGDTEAESDPEDVYDAGSAEEDVDLDAGEALDAIDTGEAELEDFIDEDSAEMESELVDAIDEEFVDDAADDAFDPAPEDDEPPIQSTPRRAGHPLEPPPELLERLLAPPDDDM